MDAVMDSGVFPRPRPLLVAMGYKGPPTRVVQSYHPPASQLPLSPSELNPPVQPWTYQSANAFSFLSGSSV